MRLIDANALVEFARERDEKTKTEGARMLLTFLRNMVELQPTVDAVPVIRCKDCKYGVYETYGEYGHYCCHDQYIETGEEFCAWAEPKVKK